MKTILRPGSRAIAAASAAFASSTSHLDIVDAVEIVVRIDAVVGHQPGQRGAVGVEIALLDAPRLDRIDAETIGDIGAHPRVDLREQVRARRIQRVVEIENPVADMGEARKHGGAGLGGARGRGKIASASRS